MKKNIGNIDLIVHYIIVIISLYFTYKFNFEDWKSYALCILSIFMIITAISRSCLLYYLLNTIHLK